jgi:hypothetical protein
VKRIQSHGQEQACSRSRATSRTVMTPRDTWCTVERADARKSVREKPPCGRPCERWIAGTMRLESELAERWAVPIQTNAQPRRVVHSP